MSTAGSASSTGTFGPIGSPVGAIGGLLAENAMETFGFSEVAEGGTSSFEVSGSESSMMFG